MASCHQPPAAPAHPMTPSRKNQVVLALIQDQDTLASLAHANGISAHELLAWRSAYFQASRKPDQRFKRRSNAG